MKGNVFIFEILSEFMVIIKIHTHCTQSLRIPEKHCYARKLSIHEYVTFLNWFFLDNCVYVLYVFCKISWHVFKI